MKTDLIIKTLRKWSPKGLCRGELVMRNGHIKTTEACAMGCLVLEFLSRPVGKAMLKSQHTDPKGLLREYSDLIGNAGLDVDTDAPFLEYYGLKNRDIETIVAFNDEAGDQETLKYFSEELPKKLQKAIHLLRKKYDSLHPNRC